MNKKYNGKGKNNRFAYADALANLIMDFIANPSTIIKKKDFQFDKNHFVDIILNKAKPLERKKLYMKFEKYNESVYEMSVAVAGEKFHGIGPTKNYACIKAALSALNYLKQYHNSDNKDLHTSYVSIVYELYQQFSSTKIIKCTIDADNRTHYESIVEVNFLFFKKNFDNGFRLFFYSLMKKHLPDMEQKNLHRILMLWHQL